MGPVRITNAIDWSWVAQYGDETVTVAVRLADGQDAYRVVFNGLPCGRLYSSHGDALVAASGVLRTAMESLGWPL